MRLVHWYGRSGEARIVVREVVEEKGKTQKYRTSQKFGRFLIKFKL